MVALQRGPGFAGGLKDVYSDLSLEESRARIFIAIQSEVMLMVCSKRVRVNYCTTLLLDKLPTLRYLILTLAWAHA